MSNVNQKTSGEKFIPYMEGKLIYLRPLLKSDLNENYLKWMNDSEVNRYMDSGSFPSTMEDLQNYYTTVALNPNNIVLAIIENGTNEHIGNIRLGPINWISRVSNFGMMIGEKSKWNRGYAKEAISMVLKYGFNKLNLHKVCLGVVTENIAAVELYKTVGFVIEGNSIKNSFINGKHVDSYYMGILKENYKASVKNN